MAAHRYWRVRIDTNFDRNAFVSTTRLQLRAAGSATDLTQGAGGTPIASTWIAEGPPAAAFDTNNNTRWETGNLGNPGGATYIGYDFGATPRDIASCVWQSRNDGWYETNLRTGALEWSDDAVTWTELFKITSANNWTTFTTRTFVAPPEGGATLAHRYWRVRIDDLWWRYQVGIGGNEYSMAADVEFFETLESTTDITAGGAAISSPIYDNNSTYSAARAFDTSMTTYWCSNAARCWIGYGFAAGAPRTVRGFSLLSPADQYREMPMLGALEYSDDNANWYVAWVYDGRDGRIWGPGQREYYRPYDANTGVKNSAAYSGEFKTFTVAGAMATLTFKAWGGAGAGGRYGDDKYGGAGGFVRGDIPVAAGDVIAVQTGQGGRQPPTTIPSGAETSALGGWPDGGSGSYGDTYGGGGGGSTRIWKNGVLMVVVGGGAGAAGYAAHGGSGGQPGRGNSRTSTSAESGYGTGGTLTAPGGTFVGWWRGRRIDQVGALGRIGGYGGVQGEGSGDDGGGGGGGWTGGGGGGGDGVAGGGGCSWTHADVTGAQFSTSNNQSAPGAGDPAYPAGGVAIGSRSNGAAAGGNGYVAFGYNAGDLVVEGTPPNVRWDYSFDRPPSVYENDDSSADVRGRTYRCSIAGAQFKKLGNKVQLCLQGHGSNGTHYQNVYIGYASSQGNDADYGAGTVIEPGSMKPVTFGGSTALDLADGAVGYSDPIDLVIDGTKPILVSVYLDPSKRSGLRRTNTSVGFGWAYTLVEKGNMSLTPGAWNYDTYWYYHFVEAIRVQRAEYDGGGGPGPDPIGRRRQLLILN